MLCTGIQDPLKLQLTQLAKVDNISWQAIPEGVAGLWKRNSTAAATEFQPNQHDSVGVHVCRT